MKRNLAGLLLVMAALALPLQIWDSPLQAAGQDERPSRENSGLDSAAPKIEYLSPGKRHKVRLSDPEIARELQAQGGRLIADYGAYKVIEVESEDAPALADKPGVEIRDEYNLILLNAGVFDTTGDEMKDTKMHDETGRGKHMHLVQFAGPVKPEWYDSLLATGVKVVSYVPNNAYLVYGNRGSLRRLRTLADRAKIIQWEGDYKDEFKIDPVFQARREKGGDLQAQSTGDLFAIQLVNDKEENPKTINLIQQHQLEPTINQWDILEYKNFVVRIPASAVSSIAKRPDVIVVSEWIAPQKFDERQNQIMAGNLTGNAPTPGDWLAYLASKGLTQSQFDASGFVVDVGDDGLDNATVLPNHPGLYISGNKSNPSRVIYARKEGSGSGPEIRGCDGHGTLNTHIVAGYVPFAFGSGFPHADSAGFRYGMGVCPFVRVGSSVVFSPAFTSPNFPNWQSRAYNDGARISSNSWGANTSVYGVESQTFDALVRDAQPATAAIPAAGNQEMVIVFAAGNAGAGAGTIGRPANAKNVIAVGAAENVHSHSTANGGTTATGQDGCGITDTGADNANDMISFSSRGPTADGRKKPEIVAPGTHVTGGVFQTSGALPANGQADACFTANSVCALPGAGNNFFPVGQQWYTTSSGTSHSTPGVAGAAALVRQHFINQSLSAPSPAMTKAVLMNSARYMTGVGANDTLWSNSQGMGEANLNSFFDIFATPSILRDQIGPDTFTASGQMRVYTGTISDNSKPFRVTLTWTDAPGPTTGNAFVNNLDLEVTVGGNTYRGNVFSGAFSTTGGAADFRNNAESVIIPAGVTGSFVITIRAMNIAGDGVPNSGGPLDQDFALVVYNANEVPIPVIEGSNATITAESCSPANGAIDPNETVTVDFALRNVGTANTTNLVATLLPTGGVTAPSGPQSYGVLVAGGPAVARPFTFTAVGNCGDTITATLQLQDGSSDLGTATFTFTLGQLTLSSVTATYSSGNIAVPIPDLSTIEIPVNVPDVGVVSDVNVRLRLNHTFDGDLDIFLVAPDNTTVELSTDNGGGGDDFGSGANDCSGTKTVFDDSAADSITTGTAPFAGSFRPEQPLSSLNGIRTNGTWKLRITDDAGADVGTVGCVEMEISRRRFRCCGIPNPPEIMAAPPAVITAESCTPANGAVDPDETVTVEFPLKNVGLGDSTDLVATLLPGGGVLSPSGPQSYGVVVADGPPVSRPFTFVATGTCGSTITATFQLNDVGGFGPVGTVSFTLMLGTMPVSTFGPFANPTSIIIPATGTGTSTGAPANPYPSTIAVAGVTGTVSKVKVTINSLSHTFPGDIDILLVGPGGQKMLLMSDAGGGTDAVNATITFNDSAPPIGATVVSGTFRPTNIGTGDAFPAPAPAGPYPDPQMLAVFNGVDPNGMWQLFVVDDAGADIGSIAGGWSLTIETSDPVCCDSPCTLTCPANVTQGNDLDQCGAVVNYPAPTVSGSCGVVACVPPSGSFFPVGTTTVTCTATRQDGATTTCTFTVTVEDRQAPSVTCNVTTTSLWPPNHNLVNVGLSATGADNCPGSTLSVEVFSDEDDEGETGDGNHSPDAKDIAPGTLRLRSERSGGGNGRVYLIIVTARDAAGNITRCCKTVTVPHSNSSGSRQQVEAEAAAARSYCEQNGTAPPGYFKVGDGPIVGPKQ